jgi:hypothetical protein
MFQRYTVSTAVPQLSLQVRADGRLKPNFTLQTVGSVHEGEDRITNYVIYLRKA